MNASPILVRAIRGPVILITIGALFAIDHAGTYPFSRTWPALIIVIGLLKLIEWALMKQVQPPAGPLTPGGAR